MWLKFRNLLAGAPVVPFSPPAKEIQAGPARQELSAQNLPNPEALAKNGQDGKPPEKKAKSTRLPWIALLGIAVLVLAVIGIASIIKGLAGKQPAPTQPVAAAEATLTPVSTQVSVTPVPTEEPLPPTPTSDPMIPPACTSIGQEWVSPLDGQTLVCVPAGSFQMGATGPNCYDACAHTVELDAFWIDKTEITNQQYVDFLLNNLSSIRKENSSLIFWKDLLDPILYTDNFGMPLRILGDGTGLHADPSVANHPVYNVSWYGAQLYCESMGRQLPSEAEWELAARGTQSFTYPWGNTFDCSKANLSENSTPQACDPYKDQNVFATSPIGSFPAGASPYGAMDMLGNVDEWVNDWYDGLYYNDSPLANPPGPETGQADWRGENQFMGVKAVVPIVRPFIHIAKLSIAPYGLAPAGNNPIREAAKTF